MHKCELSVVSVAGGKLELVSYFPCFLGICHYCVKENADRKINNKKRTGLGDCFQKVLVLFKEILILNDFESIIRNNISYTG